jgi:hypothetical protein
MPKKPNFSKFFSVYLRQDVPENHEGEIQLDCPLLDCENPTNHFFGNCDTGEWHCKRCDEAGNARTLITKIHQQYFAQTTVKQWKHLAKLRKGISADIFQTAGFAYDAENDRWLIPYYTYDPTTGDFTQYLNNLGICYPSSNDEPFVIRRAPTLPTYLYNPGLHYYPHETDRAVICEGEWDTLAYYDMYPNTPDLVLGKPGSGFPVSFLKTLVNCNRIDLLLDNDSSGLKQRAKAILTIREHKPKAKIFVLDWSLIPDATKDIRDYCVANPEAPTVLSTATILYTDDVKDLSNEDEESEGPPEETLTAGYVRDATQFEPIFSFQEYVTHLESYLYLNEETKLAMAAVIGITISGEIPGEPIWSFLIGPPSSGKTQFIESFGGSNQWFDNLSKITAESFVSGWRDETGEEPSYLPSLKNKTLFVKDFTTTLMGPTEAQHKVFGLLTDIYDGHVKIHFGNNQMREFHDTYFNMVAGVTDIVHNHSAATIGERFLRIDWLGKNYDRREYTRRALQNFGKTANRKNQLTAWTLGFVKHLREQTIDTEIPPHYLNAIVDLAEFIAIVRTKVVSDRFEGMVYKPRPELGPRLGLTLAKLFVACRLVTGSSEAAFKVVHKVAFDTCYGFALDIVRFILANPWSPRQEIAQGTNIHQQRAYRVLDDLCATSVLVKRSSPKGSGRPPNYYELNASLLPALRNDFNENRPTNERPRPTGPSNDSRPGKPRPSKRRS